MGCTLLGITNIILIYITIIGNNIYIINDNIYFYLEQNGVCLLADVCEDISDADGVVDEGDGLVLLADLTLVHFSGEVGSLQHQGGGRAHDVPTP